MNFEMKEFIPGETIKIIFPRRYSKFYLFKKYVKQLNLTQGLEIKPSKGIKIL